MKTRLKWMMAAALVGSVTAASALAASPKPGAVFKGTGNDYMNNGPTWTNRATGKISFSTSTKGDAILRFKGGYSFYCGAGTATVTATSMSISKSGKFSYDFFQPTRGPNGKLTGMAYAAISGSFEKGGNVAKVSYLIDFVAKGQTVKHPYSTSNPRALGCASWVRGTVKAK